jgi:hypothetical protein
MTFSLALSKNETNMFSNWSASIHKKKVMQIRVGGCAILWAMWNIEITLFLTN